MKKLKTLFLGTPDFAVPTLETLHKHEAIELVKVITMPDRPAGRGQELASPPVAIYAKENGIPLLQTENINKEEIFLNEIKNQDIDLIIVLAFAQFLGTTILNIPKIGCFNIHTSILPKYRGAAPIQYALLNGDSSTGVSIQKMVKKMDAGDLVHFNELNILPDETGGSLYNRLKISAGSSCGEFIQKVLENKIVYTPQDESKVTFAPTLKKEDGLIDFKNSDFETIKNKIRAFDPWPGTYCFLNNKRMKIFSIREQSKKLAPGEVNTDMGMILVGTKSKTAQLELIQLEGKSKCSDQDLLKGYREKIIINPSIT